jgi:hypothetical protein
MLEKCFAIEHRQLTTVQLHHQSTKAISITSIPKQPQDLLARIDFFPIEIL